MQKGDEIPLTNLRLIGSIKEGEFPCTDSYGNVSSTCENTYWNSFLAGITMENWSSTQYCLKTLYTEQLPELISKLMKSDSYDELYHLQCLISGSLDGLRSIKDLYKRNYQREAWLDSIILDYAQTQISNICKYFNEENYNIKIDSDNEEEEGTAKNQD